MFNYSRKLSSQVDNCPTHNRLWSSVSSKIYPRRDFEIALKNIIIIIGTYGFFLSVLVYASLHFQDGYAFTYESQDWWFSPEQGGPDQAIGTLGIIFTYPDKVTMNDTIGVNVRIEYMDNDNARGEYAILDNMTVHLRNINSRLRGDISHSENATSHLLRPGGIFVHNFSIPTQNTSLQFGNYYAIDLSFVVSFGMKTRFEIYYWDSGKYFGSSIEPQELKPFELVDQKSSEKSELTLRTNKPFGLFKPIGVIIDNKPFTIQKGVITQEFQYDSSSNANSREDILHRIKIDETIPLEYDDGQLIARGNFTSWSDGSENPERIIRIDKNTELFAIYTMQYYVNTTSRDFPNNVEGGGWYNSGERVQVSMRTLNNNNSQTFARWDGDVDPEIDAASSSIGFIVNGPKTIEAIGRQNEILDVFRQLPAEFTQFFYSFLVAAIIGPIVAWFLTTIYSRKERKRNLIYLKTYIPMIGDLRRSIKEKDGSLTLLIQKRNEITILLQSGLISIETFRLLSDHITDSLKDIRDSGQNK